MYKGSRIITQKEKEELARKIKSRMEAFSRRTLGGPCPTPGLRIRSKGRGRGYLWHTWWRCLGTV
mgnify:CR=1 FL=1